jgi:ATP-dependent exoDNAse (exonuclease V) alpha subunit
MAERERHEVNDADRQAALARAEQRGLVLSGEQADALARVTDGRDLGIVVGHAGTGKSAMLGVAREAWEAAGYEVRGVALSGIAAENLACFRELICDPFCGWMRCAPNHRICRRPCP